MSKFDGLRISRYTSNHGGEVTIMVVLENLKAQLALEQEALKKATSQVRQLNIAIEALERDAAAQAHAIQTQRPTRKRGHLSKAILDCIREGIGTVSLIHKTLEERGVVTTGPSISNAIQRLQGKHVIETDLGRKLWVIKETSDTQPRHEETGRNELSPRSDSSP